MVLSLVEFYKVKLLEVKFLQSLLTTIFSKSFQKKFYVDIAKGCLFWASNFLPLLFNTQFLYRSVVPKVVSIDLFLVFFMPFSYNGVYFRAAQVSYPISIMTLLFYYLAPLQNCTDVTSLCMQFIFGDKGAATCLIRECPTVSHVGMCQVCLLGTSLHLRMALYTALPVTEKEGKGEVKKSITPWTKYGHANLSSFCSYTNEGCSVFNLSLLFLCTCPTYRFVSLRLFHNCYL